MKKILLPFYATLIAVIFMAGGMNAQDIQIANDPIYGDVLTDIDGNTLYFFTKDSDLNATSCMGGCADIWPAFYEADPTFGTGFDAADFGEFLRVDGDMQTTYKGWPLYYFINDALAGDVNGEGVNNIWYVAKPDYSIMLINDILVGNDGNTYDGNYDLGEEEIQFFVDSKGRTLYTWANDFNNENNFTLEDLSNNGVWPVYDMNLQNIPSVLDESLFDEIDVFGMNQITYKGWPLYYFGQDAERGETKGVSVPVPGIWPVGISEALVAPENPALDVQLNSNATYGDILTDVDGKTLYFFTKDSEINSSSCTDGCLDIWPIFYEVNPNLGTGLDAANFGEFERADGEMQTTYKGWPLYYFANDANSGDTNGEAINNIWFVAKPDYGVMLINDILIGNDGNTYDGNYELGEEEIQFFVDSEGRTLYTWVNDYYGVNNFTLEDLSNNGVWPVYDMDLQNIPSILDESLFNVIDVFGLNQITYKGWPLYYFGQDTERGETKGVSVPVPGIWPVTIQDIDEAIAASIEDLTSKYSISISPNPFNDVLNFNIEALNSSKVIIKMFNSLGQEIEVLYAGSLNSGNNTFVFDGFESIPSGAYYVDVQNEKSSIAKIKLLKY